jgi:Zn-finger nucleic acid-binding protein
MQCPKCDAEMEKVSFATHEIDRCTSCKGLWFDMLEHEDLKKIAGSETIDIGDPEEGKKHNDQSTVLCPKCHIPMVKMVDINQRHIWYETCHTCFGVFFDAGEFRDYKEDRFLDYFKDLFAKERK